MVALYMKDVVQFQLTVVHDLFTGGLACKEDTSGKLSDLSLQAMPVVFQIVFSSTYCFLGLSATAVPCGCKMREGHMD
ncbi:hypothetical protein H5410_023326 [Solanum commersonii]|uniref:Uncharacterized protein n=1 Tax=Solanum commersonii TaxID=4109 RepID=A0A9J5ZHY7_SOLCO|nr:hypothetical protein H5410_023326 [Solanum commersonii]